MPAVNMLDIYLADWEPLCWQTTDLQHLFERTTFVSSLLDHVHNIEIIIDCVEWFYTSQLLSINLQVDIIYYLYTPPSIAY